MFLSKTNSCDRARGKGVMGVLDSGTFKAQLLVEDLPQGVSALIPMVVSSVVVKIHLNYVDCCPEFCCSEATWILSNFDDMNEVSEKVVGYSSLTLVLPPSWL